MSQADRNPKFRHSFFAGLLLVPLLHVAFTIVWIIISIGLAIVFPFFNTSYNGWFLLYPIFALGLTQVACLTDKTQEAGMCFKTVNSRANERSC